MLLTPQVQMWSTYVRHANDVPRHILVLQGQPMEAMHCTVAETPSVKTLFGAINVHAQENKKEVQQSQNPRLSSLEYKAL